MITQYEDCVGGVRGAIQYMRDATHLVTHADGLLLWDAKGKIVACGEYHDLYKQLPTNLNIQDYRGHLITPGFVDCHVHLPQLDCRNKMGLTLLDWLQRYIYPPEAAFADPVIARDTAQRFYRELLQSGTTTAMIYSTIHEEATRIAFEEAELSGVRAIIGKVMMDQNCPDALKEKASESFAATERLIRDWHGRAGRLYYSVTPRYALTCSKQMLEGAGKIARDSGCYFQTHIAETRDEVLQAGIIFGTQDYVGLYGQCDCLGDKSIFAHCIYLHDTGWQQLADSQSVVAHCPSSNIFLRSGRMPFENVARFNVRCGLGSDVGAGPEFSLWDVIRCGHDQHPANVFSPTESFYRATLGGAEALGLADQIGSFAVGKCADLAVFPKENTMAVATYISGRQVAMPPPEAA